MSEILAIHGPAKMARNLAETDDFIPEYGVGSISSCQCPFGKGWHLQSDQVGS